MYHYQVVQSRVQDPDSHCIVAAWLLCMISLSKAEMWCWIIAEAMRHNRHQVPLITCCQRGLLCYLLATRFCHESGLGLPIRKPRRPIWKCHLQAQPMVSHSLRNIHGAKAITFIIELFSHCDNAKGLFCTDTIICIQPMFQKNLFMRILSKLMCEIGSFSIEGQWQCLKVLSHLKLYS